MKTMLKMEELVQFLACLGGLIAMDATGWVYPLLLVGPDIGMLGYLAGPRTGAFTYNLLHHKGLAMVVVMLSQISWYATAFDAWMGDLDEVFLIAGLILFGHASMDRIFGYGLKFGDNFHHTHLGWIGKSKSAGPAESGVR